MTVSDTYPEGFLDAVLCRPEIRKAKQHAGGAWRDPAKALAAGAELIERLRND